MADEERKDQRRSSDQVREPVVDIDGGEPEAEQPETAAVQLEELNRQLEEAQAKAEENWNEFLRARAELENVRRRAERDVEQAHRYALEKFANELLAVRDSLEMGASAAQEKDADVARLREGTELTLRMLSQAMDKFGIEEVNPLGQKFDPSSHEAMATQESAEHDPNTVIHVVQKGYRLGERLLRPAMVIVSKGVDKSQRDQGEGQA